ncbi:type II toxin-antitoxin system RelE/ParE family toxin [Flavobacterium sp. ov086]|uniref:type II toxin-antitoxin system RelE/ParE family toxin n=1 Tax=Flavobacterium sp. ov086 TaxID=1761785 RepID=UPI000B68F79E|nr:type II toxin-antitoxin system RelE/ParE family toxin [Flavobacterium sp. ov086]SNR79999.1 Plasmid stabilization system protein ParE [Flavobacterium sp. ov086]
MSNVKLVVSWTQNAKEDLKEIYISLKKEVSKETALKIRDELFDCRRIIIRNYKVLYQFKDNSIFVIRVFNSFQNPMKSLK